MTRSYRLIRIARTRPLIRAAMPAIVLIVALLSSRAGADTLVGTNGLSLTGEILSMADGELTFKTQVGTHTLPMSEVSRFTIERAAAPEAVHPATAEAPMMDTRRILDRLDGLAATLAGLERQILRVQTSQAAQSAQIEQRTYDLNPQQNLKVSNTRIGKKSAGTVVTGEITNGASVAMPNVQAEVILYSRAGRLRLSGGEKRKTVPVNPPVLQPGETGTFAAQFGGGLTNSDYRVIPRALSPAGFNSDMLNQPNANQY